MQRKRHPTRTAWLAIFVGSVMALMLVACASNKAKPAAEPTRRIVWPAAPAEPRIAYVSSIHRPADVGVKLSGFSKFARWVTGSSSDDQLIKPFGVAVDERDNLCITDTGANVVCYFDRSKKKWKRWDKVGKNLRFASPVAVAKRDRTFYVVDSALACVIAFNDDGKLLFQIKEKLERPAGIAIVGDRLFVVDSKRQCVCVYDLQGHFVAEFGKRGSGPGEFNFPSHITSDRSGNLYVTDSMNSRVQLLDTNGVFKAQIGSVGDSTGHFSRPKGVAVDSFGHVYVIDGLFDNIQVFDGAGQFLLPLGEAGNSPGEFWLPNGIAMSQVNEIFVADCYNRRVQIFKYIGAP